MSKSNKSSMRFMRTIIGMMVGVVVLIAACKKKAVVGGTRISGKVTHAGKGYPEGNVRVIAVLYYNGFSISGSELAMVLDSAITAADGSYAMNFQSTRSGDSIMVYCEDEFVTTAKRIVPEQVNNNVDLSVLAVAPVIVHDLHIINNKYPPVVVFYNKYDSVIVYGNKDTVVSYTDYRQAVYQPFVTDQLAIYLDCYDYRSGEKQSLGFVYFHLAFADTMTFHTNIDASLFTPE